MPEVRGKGLGEEESGLSTATLFGIVRQANKEE
jgi:hypothetical protein